MTWLTNAHVYHNNHLHLIILAWISLMYMVMLCTSDVSTRFPKWLESCLPLLPPLVSRPKFGTSILCVLRIRSPRYGAAVHVKVSVNFLFTIVIVESAIFYISCRICRGFSKAEINIIFIILLIVYNNSKLY